MIHELTHVWQYQHNGSTYLADAVFAQATGDGDWSTTATTTATSTSEAPAT